MFICSFLSSILDLYMILLIVCSFFLRPTSEFPHPLSRVKQPIGYRVSLIFYILLILICIGAFVGQFFISLLNGFFFSFQLSYQIVDALIWLGIRDMINEFRKKMLKLRRTTYLSGYYSTPPDVPYGYIWSPHLVPKPKGHI